MKKLCIAGLPVCIDSADKAWFAERFAAYERQDDRPPVMEMTTAYAEQLPAFADAVAAMTSTIFL